MWTGGARAVIQDEEGRVLMLRQRHEGRDIWMLPGGTIEADEDAMQAARREVKEETGLDVAIGPMLWHVEEVSETKGQRFVNFFLATIEGGALSLGHDPERGNAQVMQEARFMTRQDMEEVENLYPAYLKDELWSLLEVRSAAHNPFKLRHF